MNYIIFEDNNYDLLRPFTDLHASFDLRIGILTNIERVKHLISENDKIQLYVRTSIKKLIEEKYPNYLVNPDIYEPDSIENECLDLPSKKSTVLILIMKLHKINSAHNLIYKSMK